MRMESNDDSKEQLEYLNLESDQLNPEFLLRADETTIKLPDPKAKTYNHLDEYEKKSGASQLGLIVKDDEGGIQPSTSSGNNNERVIVTSVNCEGIPMKINMKEREEELKKTLTPNVRFQKRDQKSVLSLMNSDVIGPQAFLFKCISKQIKVVIRRRKIIFQHHEQIASIFGFLVAFDKHYNLILSNVIEKVGLVQTSANCPDDLPKNVRRHLKTIFIRGSNVLTVSLDSPEDSIT